MSLDKELQDYYEARLRMFTEKGWKDLVADVQQMLDANNRLDGVTPENLGFKQGEVSIMKWLIDLPQISEKAYSDLLLSVPEGAQD